MSELEQAIVSILKDFGGEASLFLITNPDSPWGKLADASTLTEAVKSLDAQGVVKYDAGNDTVVAA
jgi:histidinol-phosphate/aromatic aminotransferase/cobyric acid decarboxylase-like protein